MPLSPKTANKKRRTKVQAPSIVIQKPFCENLLYKAGRGNLNTTIGDLICAIYDAASEVSHNEKLVNRLTELALSDIFKKKAQKKR